MAHHAYAGQDWPRALIYQIEAGRHAQRLFANHEAIDHFTKASATAPSSCTPDETVVAASVDSHRAGRVAHHDRPVYDQALEHLSTARTLAVEHADVNGTAHVCRWLARLYELRGEYPAALDWVRQGLEVLEGRETADAAEMLITAGLIYSRQGEHDTALEVVPARR